MPTTLPTPVFGSDPNEALDDERIRGKDHQDVPLEQRWGEDQNPLRETPTPFGNMTDGGSGVG